MLNTYSQLSHLNLTLTLRGSLCVIHILQRFNGLIPCTQASGKELKPRSVGHYSPCFCHSTRRRSLTQCCVKTVRGLTRMTESLRQSKGACLTSYKVESDVHLQMSPTDDTCSFIEASWMAPPT